MSPPVTPGIQEESESKPIDDFNQGKQRKAQTETHDPSQVGYRNNQIKKKVDAILNRHYL